MCTWLAGAPRVVDSGSRRHATPIATLRQDGVLRPASGHWRVVVADNKGDRAEPREGGEQQRVAIARALVTDPLMILADEPTGALDTKTATIVMEIFKNLQSENRAIVLVTHDLEIAEQMDRVVSMRDGKIVADDLRSERTDALEDRFWEAGKGGKLE